MGFWSSLFENRANALNRLHAERRPLLPAYTADEITPALPAKEVTKIALRLKYQIEQVIPYELEQSVITNPNSNVITKSVIHTARQAGGEEYRACILFCLLVCQKWFHTEGLHALWDSPLCDCRALACQVIAKKIIETEGDQEWLHKEALLKRYSILRKGEVTPPVNVVERAVDMHALYVIGSSGYQKCLQGLWRGWLVQDEREPSQFVDYKNKINTSYWAHFDPDRMRVPLYQNALLIFFSLLYLALYTNVINTVNPDGDIDVAEGILYTMTLSYLCDEFAKIIKIGKYYIGFWNVFNFTLFSLLAVSFILRMAALAHSTDVDDAQRRHLNQMSYNFLAFTAPMFWMRLLLFLDTFRFFGAMLVVLKVMMKESLIFFALLFVVLVGFFQGFIGLNNTDLAVPVTSKILKGMANSIMQSPDFDAFEDFAPPFGILLYYVFNFIVMIVLLNILIALYNSSYEDISGNADDEYMALFSARTLQYVRAPDENVFIPPFNLIEILFLILPFEWWLSTKSYERLNDIVMSIIYFPLLLVTSYLETRDARWIRWNRRHGEADDTIRQEWEDLAHEVGFDGLDESDEWVVTVKRTKPNVDVTAVELGIRELKEQVRQLTEAVKALMEEKEKSVLEGSQ
ncbi:potassium ion channel Yvc1, putative [Talaromyces stipitatus ATCC 10500]|uniref:Potassium ion channel Yvc1, putative n=1 Tax=Talaromyces stipitatus (strain ATCC 10500 / CBS 375.48 / QM 6759 / NRRL 1006) TaxID=441959 RepID=B8M594_TALSN|nr:potassium ion channel Yvc1, putative [Talaromyces stipitatus ATCC 10500]EED19700.1 potassium ion channel Yvc1, putative [Talaromyces stipitatus ATCC 10500]